MLNAWVSDEYIHFLLMYTIDCIFSVLPIEHLVDQGGKPTTPHKMSTGTKPSISNLCVLFCTCGVRKSTAHVDTKALNMCHQSKKGFCGIFIVIIQHQKGYLVYVPSTQKIISSHYVVFDKIFSCALSYTPHPYSEVLSMWPVVSYFHTLHHPMNSLATL